MVWVVAVAAALAACAPAQTDTAAAPSSRPAAQSADSATAATDERPASATPSAAGGFDVTMVPGSSWDEARPAGADGDAERPDERSPGARDGSTAPDGAAAVADDGAPTDGSASDAPLTGAPDDDTASPSRPPGPRLVAVRPGDSGAKVERLQRRLDRLGFAPGAVDGAYGQRTADAVAAFQMIVGRKQTGRADAATVAALASFEPEGPVVRAGDTGKAVKRLQRRLARGPFDPGPADGAYGTKTVEAVWALEKLAGVPVDGDWGPLDEHALERFEAGELARPTRQHQRRWVEFDLSQQVMKVYDPGSPTPVLVSHGSSGSGIPWQNEEHSGSSVTPPGDFVISRRIAGWRESSLNIGRLYNPLYFNGGIAFHGALSVPLYPASHGCVRLPMHVAEYLPERLPNGTPVHIVQ